MVKIRADGQLETEPRRARREPRVGGESPQKTVSRDHQRCLTYGECHPRILETKGRMRQSSRLHTLLPAYLVLLLLGVADPTAPRLEAQERYQVVRAENFRREASPDSPILAELLEGVTLTGTASGRNWVAVALDGWIWSRSVGQSDQDEFDLRVNVSGGENLRDAPNGVILARLSQGTYLNELSRTGNWIRVRRNGFVWASSLEIVAATQADSGGRVTNAQLVPTLDHALLAHETRLARVPEGEETGTLEAETPVRILARSGEWVRVQTEGWVRESDVKAAAGVLEGVSGAEVRARPEEYDGKLIEWTLQYLTTQVADELRSEIPEGQRYILARGPLPEAGFVYVTFPESRLPEIERLSPLAQLVVIGRVRVARSKYLGNPILELVDMTVRQQ
jgi:hypothetical protein